MGGGEAPAQLHTRGAAEDEALTSLDHLIRIADRLAEAEAGSDAADRAIHEALGRGGPVQRYTTSKVAAWTLLPLGFEWLEATYLSGLIYVPCRHAGFDAHGMPYRRHGQWACTLPLSMCGGVLRAWAMLDDLREGRPRS